MTESDLTEYFFFCKISNFCKYKFPYFASKNEFQIFTTISKVCQKKLKILPQNIITNFYQNFQKMPGTKWHCPNIWRRLPKNQLLSVMFNFCQLRILSTFILSSLFLSNRCPSTLLCQVGFCQTLRSLFVLESGSSNWNNAKYKFRSINWQGLWMRSESQNYEKLLEKAFICILKMQMKALSAVWQMYF